MDDFFNVEKYFLGQDQGVLRGINKSDEETLESFPEEI